MELWWGLGEATEVGWEATKVEQPVVVVVLDLEAARSGVVGWGRGCVGRIIK